MSDEIPDVFGRVVVSACHDSACPRLTVRRVDVEILDAIDRLEHALSG